MKNTLFPFLFRRGTTPSESLVTSVEAESGTTGEVRRVALALAEGTLGVNVDIERPG